MAAEPGPAPSDRLRATYDRRAALDYARPPGRIDATLDRKYERMLQLVASTLPADSVLDAGCGDGRYLAAIGSLPDRPRRLVGVDISQRILATAAATLEPLDAGANLLRANLERLPFPEGSFERVLSVQVIEHLLAPEQGLAELARVLRPRGRLVLSTDNARNHVSKLLNLPRTTVVHSLRLGGRRRRVAFPHRAFTVGEVEALVAGSGLVVEHLETFRFHLDPPFDRRSLMTLANTADRRLPPHGFGDLIAVIASKPGGRLQTK